MPRRKHHSTTGDVRGRIIRTTRKKSEQLRRVGITLQQPAGTNLGLLMKVKTGSSRHLREFEFFCTKHALTFVRAGERKPPSDQRWKDGRGNEVPDPTEEYGWSEVFEVSGYGPALAELTAKPCVASWCFMLNVGAPHFNSRLWPKWPNH